MGRRRGHFSSIKRSRAEKENKAGRKKSGIFKEGKERPYEVISRMKKIDSII